MNTSEILEICKNNNITLADVKSALESNLYNGDNTENIVNFLHEVHNKTLTEGQISEIRKHQEDGYILFPVVLNAQAVHSRIITITGEGYNHPKDKGVSINTALGFDRRSSQVYILKVKDSLEPDTDLRISWNKLTTEKPETDILRQTEYMALYDYVLTTRNQKLDITTWTRTATAYTCSNFVAIGDTIDGLFELGYSDSDDDVEDGGFRAVSAVVMLET